MKDERQDTESKKRETKGDGKKKRRAIYIIENQDQDQDQITRHKEKGNQSGPIKYGPWILHQQKTTSFPSTFNFHNQITGPTPHDEESPD